MFLYPCGALNLFWETWKCHICLTDNFSTLIQPKLSQSFLISMPCKKPSSVTPLQRVKDITMLCLPYSWWRHQMETFSALLAICAGNSPVSGEFRAQRPVTRRFDVSFDLRLNKRLSKQSWGWWFEAQTGSLWRHCNVCLINCTFNFLPAISPQSFTSLELVGCR